MTTLRRLLIVPVILLGLVTLPGPAAGQTDTGTDTRARETQIKQKTNCIVSTGCSGTMGFPIASGQTSFATIVVGSTFMRVTVTCASGRVLDETITDPGNRYANVFGGLGGQTDCFGTVGYARGSAGVMNAVIRS